MRAGRNKNDVAQGTGVTQGPHDLEPAGQSAASLPGAMPPAAARGHDYERRQGLVRPTQAANNVEGLRICPSH